MITSAVPQDDTCPRAGIALQEGDKLRALSHVQVIDRHLRRELPGRQVDKSQPDAVVNDCLFSIAVFLIFLLFITAGLRDHQLVATLVFGAIQGRISSGQETLNLSAVLRETCNSNRNGDGR